MKTYISEQENILALRVKDIGLLKVKLEELNSHKTLFEKETNELQNLVA